MRQKIKVDRKRTPIPPIKRAFEPLYPFNILQVGWSFLLPLERETVPPYMYFLARKHKIKITVRKVEGGWRIWRIK